METSSINETMIWDKRRLMVNHQCKAKHELRHGNMENTRDIPWEHDLYGDVRGKIVYKLVA